MSTITGTNVTIMVADMDRAISFYESIGVKLQQRWENHYAMMTTAGLTIGIHPSGSDNTSSGTLSIGFMIDSIDATQKLLQDNNISFSKEDDGKSGIYLHFKDPDGTILYFVKPMW